MLAIVPLLALACSPAPAPDAGQTTPPDSAQVSASTPSTPPMLESTYWRLVALGDTPVTPADTARQAHITLSGGTEKRVTGSGGCNRMFGSYTLDGTALAFSKVGATKMACAEGMETESAFFSALERVTGWRIAGQQLELTDSAGVPVARFEAQAPK
jgi:heat shock protein HslJ